MDYVKFGHTGLDVSPMCLGCMSFGSADGWVHNQWALSEEDSRVIIKRALDLGIAIRSGLPLSSLRRGGLRGCGAYMSD